MARLNSNKRRSPTASSLYRDRTPAGESPSLAPTPSFSSDKENDTPAQGAKNGKQRALTARATMEPDERANKRRRLSERDANATQNASKKAEDFYDPEQNVDVRRELRHGMRLNTRELFDNRDKYMESNSEIVKLIDNQNDHFNKVRQTADAAIDARFLVDMTDVVLQKNTRLILGNESIALSMDEFVSKCITFMKFGGPGGEGDDAPTATQARRRVRAQDDEEDEGDEGDALAWEYLGEKACYPHTRRPPAPAFLLGPLSVQKKQRAPTQRSARLRKDTQAVATRPQELQAEDIERNEKSTLTHMCRSIREQLTKHNIDGNKLAEEEANQIPQDVDDDEADSLMRGIMKKHRLADNNEVPFFDFAVNPQSFGQTVENFFYISFLIKDGFVRIGYDGNGQPTLRVLNQDELKPSHGRKKGSSRHQAIFTMSYGTWEKLIKAYKIEEPLIPHREEDTQQIGARGWYG